jgi:dolichyl-phosphate beta-glucosyltransferase
MKAPYLSVIIPAFNEENRIAPTLVRISSYLSTQPYDSETVVVDNGSTDRTSSVVRNLMQSTPNLRLIVAGQIKGKGYAVSTGMLHTTGNYVLFSDADLSTPIEDVERLFRHLESGADIAIGSRALKASEILQPQPVYRQLIGKLFSLLVQTIALRGINDTQCGFKCFKRDVIVPLLSCQTIFGFCFDVELLFIARKHGYRVVEIPVRWINDPRSQVSPLKDSFRMLVDIVRIRINALAGSYDAIVHPYSRVTQRNG